MPLARDRHLRPINGLTHRVLTWRSGAAPRPLVLLHGWLDVAASFDAFAERLAGRVGALDAIAPDLRGHGGTDHVGAGGYYHFADYVADVADLVDTLPGPVDLLGHSMGGTIASMFAAAFPERVRRLVLVEGLGPPTDDPEPAPDRFARWIREVRETRKKPARTLPDLAAAAARLRATTPALDESRALAIAAEATRPVDGGVTWAFDPLHRTRSPVGTSVEAYRSFLARLACPVLLVEGGASGFRGWIADDRERDVRDLRRLVIDGAGHMLHHEAPDALAEAVAAFLSEPP